ncbi:MAG: ATP-dependent Clp protease adaptor ClpS [Fibrobacterota bacterium]
MKKKDIRTKVEDSLQPLYRVLLHNDDSNSFEYVINVLIRVFRWDSETAVVVTMEAHNRGTACCAVLGREVAELKRDLIRSAGLSSTIEPET